MPTGVYSLDYPDVPKYPKRSHQHGSCHYNMSVPKLSIIIPALNEAANLRVLIGELRQQTLGSFEIIIADGGSQDETLELIKVITPIAKTQRREPPVPSGGPELIENNVSLINIIFCQAPRGRGKQMNAGARLAKSPLLLFLHADSRLDDPELLSSAIEAWESRKNALDHDRLAGHFPLEFVQQPANRQLIFAFYAAKTALNRPQCTNGDQGFLLSRNFFAQLGGFAEELPFLEDQILAGQIYQQGEWITLPGTLTTSARRFREEGLARRMVLNALIMAFHYTGFKLFFVHAPGVYREQTNSRQLQLVPFFKLINRLNREAGWRGAWERWRRVGGYVRGAAWQLFFILDLLLAAVFKHKQRPFIAIHDHVFSPLTNFWIFDMVTALLTWIWFKSAEVYYGLREAKRS